MALLGIVRPNANNNELWSGHDYINIDEVVVQPNAGGGDVISADKYDDMERQQYDMQTLSGVESVTQIVLWVYASGIPLESYKYLRLNIAPGGVWQTEQSKALTTSMAWYSATFNGTWTQADLDSLLIGLTTDTMGTNDNTAVDVAYCEIYGTLVPPDYGDFFFFLGEG